MSLFSFSQSPSLAPSAFHSPCISLSLSFSLPFLSLSPSPSLSSSICLCIKLSLSISLRPSVPLPPVLLSIPKPLVSLSPYSITLYFFYRAPLPGAAERLSKMGGGGGGGGGGHHLQRAPFGNRVTYQRWKGALLAPEKGHSWEVKKGHF